jgi:uncharacterized delta-60 repeat protein
MRFLPRRARSRRGVLLLPQMESLEARGLLAVASGLDPTFGGGTGYFLAPVNTGSLPSLGQPNLVAVEADGSILVAGPVHSTGVSQGFGVIHLNVNGTLDTSFGQDGEANVVAPSGTTFSGSPTSLLVQPDGKILLFGLAFTTGSGSNSVAVVVRFDANGSPDPTFGTDGVTVINLVTLGATDADLTFAALQPDGDIVLAGTSTIDGGTLEVDQQIAALQLNSNGTVDTLFGTNGVVQFSDIPAGNYPVGLPPIEETDGLAVEPDGQILILGNITDENATGPATETPELFRLNANGSKDGTFSDVALVASGLTSPTTNGLIVQPDGEILVLGRSADGASNVPALERLNEDGSLEATATFPGLPNATYTLISFALEPDGDVALTGVGLSTSVPLDSAFEAIQLTPNLTPDTAFGVGGISTTQIAAPAWPGGTDTTPPLYSTNLAVSPDNQIVMLGSNPENSGTLALPAGYYAVVRLTSTGSTSSATSVEPPNDYLGNGISDPAVYLPASGSFEIQPTPGGPDVNVPFGIAGAGQTIPAPGDYTKPGLTDLAAYLPSQGVYAIRPANGGPDIIVPFGIAGAGQTIPAPGDYFGTGQDDIAVYLASIGAFAIRNPAGGPDEIIPFGIPGIGNSIPVPGDYDGSGKTELAVYMPSLGEFAYRPADGGPDVIEAFGVPGAGQTIPMPGDYDGSGKTEIAAYIPSQGVFAYRPADGSSDVIVPFGIPGTGQTLPAPGDYDGSGVTEIAVYLPAQGVFAYRPVDGAPDVVESFGVPGLGKAIPVTVVDESAFVGATSVPNGMIGTKVSAMAVDLLDFDPELMPKKHKVGDLSTADSSTNPI